MVQQIAGSEEKHHWLRTESFYVQKSLLSLGCLPLPWEAREPICSGVSAATSQQGGCGFDSTVCMFSLCLGLLSPSSSHSSKTCIGACVSTLVVCLFVALPCGHLSRVSPCLCPTTAGIGSGRPPSPWRSRYQKWMDGSFAIQLLAKNACFWIDYAGLFNTFSVRDLIMCRLTKKTTDHNQLERVMQSWRSFLSKWTH